MHSLGEQHRSDTKAPQGRSREAGEPETRPGAGGWAQDTGLLGLLRDHVASISCGSKLTHHVPRSHHLDPRSNCALACTHTRGPCRQVATELQGETQALRSLCEKMLAPGIFPRPAAPQRPWAPSVT